MVLYDRTIGTWLHLINTTFFYYYLLWIGLTPFIDHSHFTQRFFPPREYGIAIAAGLVSLLLLVTLSVAALHIALRTGEPEQQQQQVQQVQHFADGEAMPPPPFDLPARHASASSFVSGEHDTWMAPPPLAPHSSRSSVLARRLQASPTTPPAAAE